MCVDPLAGARSLIVADFDWLPDVRLPGRNAPLVAEKEQGVNKDHDTVLVPWGKADIFFPTGAPHTHAHTHARLEGRCTLPLSGSACMGAHQHVASPASAHADFDGLAQLYLASAEWVWGGQPPSGGGKAAPEPWSDGGHIAYAHYKQVSSSPCAPHGRLLRRRRGDGVSRALRDRCTPSSSSRLTMRRARC